MADLIDEESISELMNAFNNFADENGEIRTPELGRVLRFLGHSPTDAELQEVSLLKSPDILVYVPFRIYFISIACGMGKWFRQSIYFCKISSQEQDVWESFSGSKKGTSLAKVGSSVESTKDVISSKMNGINAIFKVAKNLEC